MTDKIKKYIYHYLRKHRKTSKKYIIIKYEVFICKIYIYKVKNNTTPHSNRVRKQTEELQNFLIVIKFEQRKGMHDWSLFKGGCFWSIWRHSKYSSSLLAQSIIEKLDNWEIFCPQCCRGEEWGACKISIQIYKWCGGTTRHECGLYH